MPQNGNAGLGLWNETTDANTPRHERPTSKAIAELAESQGYCCALTGWELTPELASLDHKQPVSREGKHVMSNLQVVHREINRAKGNMTTEEFVEMCRAVVGHHRST